MKRIVSMLLALAMVFTMVTPAFAEAVPLPEAEPQQVTQPAAEEPAPETAPAPVAVTYTYEALDKAPMKESVQASSVNTPEQWKEGPAALAFDNNTETAWHTNYADIENHREDRPTSCEYSIEWDLKADDSAVLVGQLQYQTKTPNQDNGKWKNIEIFATLADASHTVKSVYKGEIAQTGDVTISFTDGPVNATHLKVVVTSSIGSHAANGNNDNKAAAAGEITVYKAIPQEETIEYLYFPLDKTPMKASVTAGDQRGTENDDGPASYAFDGNLNSHWHTDYNQMIVQNGNGWIKWNLGNAEGTEAVSVGRLVYIVRDDKGNGLWKKILVEATVNGANQKIYEGPVELHTAGFQKEFILDFEPVEATSMKITVQESLGNPVNKYACASEIELFKAVPKAGYQKPEVPDASSFKYEELPQSLMMDFDADSEYPGKTTEGPACLAFDGRLNTHWHNNYNQASNLYPYMIGWGIGGKGEPQLVGKIQYIPRSGNNYGNWKKIAVYGRIGSPEDPTFSKLHAEADSHGKLNNRVTYDDGEWVRLVEVLNGVQGIDGQKPVDIVFDKPAYVTHLMVKVNEAYTSNFATAGEIKTFKAIPKVAPPVPDTPTEYAKVPRSEITGITASSEKNPPSGNDGPAEWAFDGDENKMWHTNYDDHPENFTLRWKVGTTAKKIGRVDYIGRPDGNNGAWLHYSLEGRNGDGEWQPLVDKKAAATQKGSMVFAPTDVTELQLTVWGKNQYAATAEIRTYEAVEVTAVNEARAALRDVYAEARLLPSFENSSYKEDVYNTYKAALDAAKNFLETSKDTSDEVTAQANAKKTALETAVAALKQADAIDLTRLADGAPAGGTSSNNPFPNAGDEGCITQNIRIPGIITLNDGKLAATADARWNHHGDHGNIDGMFSISEDNGVTWNYTFPMFFNDSTNLFHDYAATLMDPAIVQDANGRIYMLIDAFPGGHALHDAAKLHPDVNSGFVDVNGKQRLAVYQQATGQNNDQYAYYVGDFAEENGKKLAPLYAKGTAADAKYYVDGWFNLYNNQKQPMVCKQIGSEKYVQQNLFYYNADLHVRSATFLMLVTSDDNGKNWSDPQLLNPENRPENVKFLGVGPAVGLSFVDADKNNVVLLPTYVGSNVTERSCFMYTADGGKTWKFAGYATDGQDKSSESVLIQIDDTTVRQFYRDLNSSLRYTDYTWNAEAKTFTREGGPVVVQGAAKTKNNQISAVRYPTLVGGKPLVLVSTANGGDSNRTNGHIYALSVEPNKTMKVVHDYAVVLEGNNGYNYSSLTVKPDGNIALFYEDSFGGNGSGAGGTSHHTYMNIAKADVLPDIKDVDVKLLVGAKHEIKSTEEVSFNSNPEVVGVATVPTNALVTVGQTGDNKQYTGEKQPLADAMYTFTKHGGENTYYVQNGSIYLKLKGNEAGKPFGLAAEEIVVEKKAKATGNFALRADTSSWLWFWKDQNNNEKGLRFDRNGSYAEGNCDFDLFRTANGDEATPDIKGFVKLKELSEIKSGEKYLIAAKAGNGEWYALRPSTDGNFYKHVLHILPAQEEATVGYTHTLHGNKAGEAVVVIGNTAYHVNVKNYNLFAQLSLQGDIAVNVGYEFAPHLITDDTRVVISVGGKQVGDHKLAEAIKKDGKYFFTLHVDARQMTEDITVVVKKGETVVGTNVFTVQDYAKIVLASNEATEAAAHNLVKHMLYYGASMQTYKNYKTDALATAILNPDDVKAMDRSAAEVTADTLAEYRAVQFEHTTGAQLSAANLDLLSKTTLQFRFDAADFGRTFAEKGGKEVTKRQLADGSVVVMIPNIDAKSLDTMYTLTVDGQDVVKYGPLSYARKVLAGENKPETLKAVVRAMKLYNDAAKAYKPASK